MVLLRWLNLRWTRFIGLTFLTLVLTLGLTVFSAPPAVYALTPEETLSRAQADVPAIAADLASRIGRSLSIPIEVTNDPYYQSRHIRGEGHFVRTFLAVDTAEGWADPIDLPAGAWDAPDANRVCLLVLGDEMTTLLGRFPADSDRVWLSTLAHEVYHCYQRDLIGYTGNLPAWLSEGAAMWAGEQFVSDQFGDSLGSSLSRTPWQQYLTEHRPLLARLRNNVAYAAIGFFSHLQNQGINVWRDLDRVYSSPSLFPDEVFQQVMELGDVEQILQTWPMGMARLTLDPEWNTSGPGITDDSRRRGHYEAIRDEVMTQEIIPTVQNLLDVSISPGDIVTIEVENGYGAIRWGDRISTRISPGFSQKYCLGESCRCEDGSWPTGVESVPVSEALIALTGYLDEGQLSISAEENPCEEEETTPTDIGRDPRWGEGDRARGTSYGDPHIITYDGLRYSFQTVGEFLLSRSGSGQFEVQARQKQVPGRQISLNTAVAMQIGTHRVAIYAQDAPDGSSPLWVDGQPETLSNQGVALADGSTILEVNNREYVIQAPTGEQVAVRWIQAQGLPFLNITPYVENNRNGQFMGLLGNLDGNPEDDLQIRNGGVVPVQSSYTQVSQLVRRVVPSPIPLSTVENAFFEQLYRQFGDSWRITQAESLFDYGPGQSTQTFTNRSFPSRFPTLTGIVPAQIEAATQTCQEAGVEPIFLEGCVFDVAATGQPDFATAAVNAIADTLIEEATNRVVDEVRDRIEEAIPIPLPRLPF
ncbi:MAG: hypothetical protein F6K42_28225 [Leptolyngbya sp. SIO1D8]|nr:hypothetical protein [Leptolyngbya sp. SIO1D8]